MRLLLESPFSPIARLSFEFLKSFYTDASRKTVSGPSCRFLPFYRTLYNCAMQHFRMSQDVTQHVLHQSHPRFSFIFLNASSSVFLPIQFILSTRLQHHISRGLLIYSFPYRSLPVFHVHMLRH